MRPFRPRRPRRTPRAPGQNHRPPPRALPLRRRRRTTRRRLSRRLPLPSPRPNPDRGGGPVRPAIASFDRGSWKLRADRLPIANSAARASEQTCQSIAPEGLARSCSVVAGCRLFLTPAQPFPIRFSRDRGSGKHGYRICQSGWLAGLVHDGPVPGHLRVVDQVEIPASEFRRSWSAGGCRRAPAFGRIGVVVSRPVRRRGSGRGHAASSRQRVEPQLALHPEIHL
jgi:hypothetical protein